MSHKKGRLKGRRLFQYKIYLTAKQIRWLQSQRSNPAFSTSSLFRALLNNYMRWKLNRLKAEVLIPHSTEKKQKLEAETKILEEYLEN